MIDRRSFLKLSALAILTPIWSRVRPRSVEAKLARFPLSFPFRFQGSSKPTDRKEYKLYLPKV